MEKRSIQSVAEILVEKATVTKKASVGLRLLALLRLCLK